MLTTHEHKYTALPVLSATDVINRIKQHKTLVQVLNANIGNDHAWVKQLRQLQEPRTYRPPRWLDEKKVDRSRLFNPKTSLWESRIVSLQRGGHKDTIYTKKQSTSLPPADGKMYFYRPDNAAYAVGIIYDIDYCHLKDEKYIFLNDECTNCKWWLKSMGLNEDKQKVSKSISLKSLIEQTEAIRTRREIPNYNEVLAGLSAESVIGIFATKNVLIHRLNALIKKNLVASSLKKELPVFIITPEDGVVIYNPDQQRKDIDECLTLADDHSAKILIKMSMHLFQDELLSIIANHFERAPVIEPAINDSDKIFLLSRNTPDVLRGLVLSYLPISDIYKIINMQTIDAGLLRLQTYSDNNYKKLLDNDLVELLVDLNFSSQPLSLLADDNQWIAHLVHFLQTKQEQSTLVERIVIHLHYAAPGYVSQLLSTCLIENPLNHLLIAALIEYGAELTVIKDKKEIGHYYYSTIETRYSEKESWFDSDYESGSLVYYYKSDGSRYRDISTNHYEPIFTYNWTILVNLLLLNNQQITRAIVRCYSQHLIDALNVLFEIYQVRDRHNFYDDTIPEKSLIINALTTTLMALIDNEQPLNRPTEEIIIFLNSINRQYCDNLLEQAILSPKKYNIHKVLMLVKHNQCQQLFTNYYRIRDDILDIDSGLYYLHQQCTNASQTNTIELLHAPVKLAVSEWLEKQSAIEELVNTIKDQYNYQNDFKVYRWGGAYCRQLNNKVVPQGIADLLSLYKPDNISQTFTRMYNIFESKHYNMTSCSFWRTKRDPQLEQFYFEAYEKFNQIEQKYRKR